MTEQKQHLSLPVQWKAAAGSPTGELVGYIAAYDNVDLGGDIVRKGALRKSFDEWSRAKAKMPLMVDHDTTVDGVVGVVTHMVEDHYGAQIHARFSSDEKAQKVRQKMIDLGGSGMSLTYVPIKSRPITLPDGAMGRELIEMKAIEATITWVPMNQNAFASAKSMTVVDDVEDISFEAFEKAMAAVLQIPVLAVRKSATHLLVASYHPTEDATAGPADGQPTEDAGNAAADTGTPADGTAQKATDPDAAAAEYALSIISKPSGPPDGAPGAEPPEALVDPLQALETQRYRDDLSQLEAQVKAALGGTK